MEHDWRQVLDMIDDQIVPVLEAIFQRQRRGVFRRLWLVQNGAPAHQRVAVRDRLRELFADRVIAIYNEIEWPPRPADLTPCDFFLFGYLKNEVLKTPPQNVADLCDPNHPGCGCLARNRRGGERVWHAEG